MRYSEQRNIIYNFVMNNYSHPTAKDVYLGLKLKHPKLSLGTVYRNLNSLVASGMIKRVEVSSGHDRFDKTTFEHSHLYCTKCGKVTDVMFSLEEVINREYNFKLLSYNSLFRGICQECLKKEEKK